VGTYPLAVLAQYHGVPFVVAAPVTTVDLETETGDGIEVEQRSGHEVTESPWAREPGTGLESGGGLSLAPVGAQAYNPAFDVTPSSLVTAIVTDQGVASPVTAESIATLCSTSRKEASGSGNGMMNA
jgi:methylthioribose-1-phosphate isomerase